MVIITQVSGGVGRIRSDALDSLDLSDAENDWKPSLVTGSFMAV